MQPGNLGDVLLHETAVSWIRMGEVRCRSARPWEETVPEFTARIKRICQSVNDHHDVEGLCRQFPSRLQQLVDAEGDRLGK